MLEKGADLCKIAVTANDISDCARVLHVLQAATNPTIMLSMTERGMLTRLLAGKYGSMLTFCSTTSGKESAPGQIAVAELRSLYRFKSIENLTSKPIAFSGVNPVNQHFPAACSSNRSRFLLLPSIRGVRHHRKPCIPQHVARHTQRSLQASTVGRGLHSSPRRRRRKIPQNVR
mmetsp:Transcript_35926/g.143606  ORF Transcript_35926/g.143606 Transcript_35926/m.143606 type:complete len:174 (-) Transcript_35926:2491-3012(-)